MKKVFFLLFISLTYFGFSQSKTECEKILSQKIDLDLSKKTDLDFLSSTFSKLTKCGLEQIDSYFFGNGPVLATLLVPLAGEKEGNITYQDLFDKIIDIKKTPEYEEAIILFKVSNDLSQRTADIKNWENDKKLLEQLMPSKEHIEKFYKFLQKNSNPNKTYAEIFATYKKYKKENKPKIEEYKGLFKNPENTNYKELLSQSKNLNKPLLLFFTGYSCVNCRKMEQNVLNDNIIIDKLKNKFHFINLYVDDKRELPNDEQFISDKSGKEIRTIGNKNSNLQIEEFNSNAQPYFVIIGNDGKKIKDQMYTRETEEFMGFLSL